GLRIISIHDYLNSRTKVITKLLPLPQGHGVTRFGRVIGFQSGGMVKAFEKITAGIVFYVFVFVGQQTDFASPAIVADVQFVLDDDSRTQSCPDGHADDGLISLAQPEFMLPQSIAVDIIVDKYR